MVRPYGKLIKPITRAKLESIVSNKGLEYTKFSLRGHVFNSVSM